MNKVYLGEGLYAYDEWFQIKLASENGVSELSAVYLGDSVLGALFEFIAQSRGLKITIEFKDE